MIKNNILIMILFFIFSFSWEMKVFAKHYTENPNIHIFFESVGSSPVIGELSEYVKLPKSDIKIVGFHRIFPLKSIDWKEENTFWIELPRQEENYIGKENYFLEQALQLLKEYPNSSIYFYTGIREYNFFKRFNSHLKKGQLKKLYLYEDGFFNLAQNVDIVTIRQQLHEMNASCVIPTTYFIAGLNYVDSKILGLKKCSLVDFKDFDIVRLSTELTPKEKDLFFRVIGFDYQKFKNIAEKKLFLFTTGHIHKNPKTRWKQTPESMMAILKRAREGMYGLIPENAIWGFKLHPSLGIYDFAPEIKNAYPDMVEISASIPFETLILAGIKPYKIIGSGSSFMFWLDKNQIMRYISHPYYDEILKKMQKISDENLIYPHLPSINKKDLQFEFIQGGLFPEYIKDRFCLKKDLRKCLLLKKLENGCYQLNWDDGKVENICSTVNK